MSDLRPEKNYIKSLDGLRALSIVLVVIFHSNLYLDTQYVGGVVSLIISKLGMGVNFFFLISGFLITGILLDTREHVHYFKNFFFRRVLRIFPLYYLLLLFAFVILPQFDHPKLEKWSDTDPTLFWLYLSNFYIASVGKFNHGLVDLSWSLSIEEQFYLIWPWVVLFINPKNLKKVCVLGVVFSLLSRYLVLYNGGSELQIYVLTFCRLDGLLLGSLLALERRQLVDLSFFMRHKFKIMIGSFIMMWFIVFSEGILPRLVTTPILYTVIAVFFGSLLILITEKKKSFFEKEFLVSIGKYSYGIYLIHNPVQSALRHVFFSNKVKELGEWGIFGYQIVFVLSVLLISYLLAYCVFHVYEKRFLKLKKHFSY